MKMPASPRSWLVAADSRTARLLTASFTALGRLHLEEVARLDEVWEEREHSRHAPRFGAADHLRADESHEAEERLRRFARALAEWLVRARKGRKIEHLDLFAAPRLLGELRKELRADGSIVEHEADLTHLSPGDMARHKAVLGLWARK